MATSAVVYPYDNALQYDSTAKYDGIFPNANRMAGPARGTRTVVQDRLLRLARKAGSARKGGV